MTYKEYMKSEMWQQIREKAFERDGYRCAMCGSQENLEGHHICYNKMGRWDDWMSVLTLCHRCHMQAEEIKLCIKAEKKVNDDARKTYDRYKELARKGCPKAWQQI